jgi:predicted DNA-binding transcriptional regulator AlpA
MLNRAFQAAKAVAPGLPETGFLRLSQVLAVIPISKSAWWEGVKSGRFPPAHKPFGLRVTCWRAEDIRALIANGGQHGS